MTGAEDQEVAMADQPVDESAANEASEMDSAESAEVQPEVTETAPEQAAQTSQAPEQQPPANKGMLGNLFDSITGNPIYQVALGGGLIVLLLLLLLLARRNANREKAFYEQLSNESEDDNESFQLSLDDDEPEVASPSDPLAEADTYIAYGRHDQAAQTLETAISREPSRTDLRLKLLGVYADSQDRESFEKQFGEVAALNDDEAMVAATELRNQLDEAEAMPSIDDLESELRSDSFAGTKTEEESVAEPTDELEDMQLSDE